MFEKFFQRPVLKGGAGGEKKKQNEPSDSRGMSRRDFLKFGAGIAVVAAVGKSLDNLELESAEQPADHESKDLFEDVREDPNDEIYYDGEEPDIQAVKEVLDFDSEGKINITSETAEKIKDYWKYTYANRMKSDLMNALESMAPHISEIRSIFREERVPEEYSLLAIPESHWKLDAVSKAGAKGPYQFTKDTGARYDLVRLDKKGKIIEDKRSDPIESGRACARCLKDLHKVTNDWDLSLSGYNGGFIWKYLGVCKSENRKPKYDDFLMYLSEKANEIKEDVRHNVFIKHRVEKSDTLFGVSRKYGVKLAVLRKYNKFYGTKLLLGKIIRIPISKRKKSQIFEAKTRGISENINYPPKFNAVLELVSRTTAWKEGGQRKEI